MIIKCRKCDLWFEDVYRSTACPHRAFLANDGRNNFSVHEDAYRDKAQPPADRIFEAHRKPGDRRSRA
jgi:hypothetical protein